VRPFVVVNVAITADGKIAPVSRHFRPFGGSRDMAHLLNLRATADAVMSGARTVDLDKVNLGPGPARYRRLRIKRGLAEFNLRVVVSGAGSIDPQAEIFRHRFSPIIILTKENASASRVARLRALADELKGFGTKELDIEAALTWLRRKRKIRRLVCEGGGELNAALFAKGLVDELHLTICPIILGGRGAPTLADGSGVAKLPDAAGFRLVSMTRAEGNVLLVYRRTGARRNVP
jgi:riboflavin-specific deaminase-like protein